MKARGYLLVPFTNQQNLRENGRQSTFIISKKHLQFVAVLFFAVQFNRTILIDGDGRQVSINCEETNLPAKCNQYPCLFHPLHQFSAVGGTLFFTHFLDTLSSLNKAFCDFTSENRCFFDWSCHGLLLLICFFCKYRDYY